MYVYNIHMKFKLILQNFVYMHSVCIISIQVCVLCKYVNDHYMVKLRLLQTLCVYYDRIH